MRSTLFAAALCTSALLTGCGDEPFALRDGCYYADDGKPILRVRGEEGDILTPRPAPNIAGYPYTPVTRVRLRARTNGTQSYVTVSPGFFLTDSNEAATSSSMSRFTVINEAGGHTIMVNVEAAGETPVRLGRPC